MEICFVNLTVGGGSNDFAIDDFSFQSDFYAIEWAHDATLTDSLATNLAPGIYEISSTTEWGCTVSIEAEIENIPPRPMTVTNLKTPGCDLYNGRAKISGENVYRINTGGSAYISPVTNFLFEGDNFVTGGSAGFNPNLVENTDESNLYQSQHLGNFTYTFPLPDSGFYEIILHFAEEDNANRLMDVLVNNSLEINDLSIYNNVGFNQAFTQSILANAPDSLLQIQLLGVGSPALLSAIEIYHAIPENSTFEWSHDANLNAPEAADLGQGNYTVIVTEPDGCMQEVVFRFRKTQRPRISINWYCRTRNLSWDFG